VFAITPLGPLNPSREFGGALQAPPAGSGGATAEVKFGAF